MKKALYLTLTLVLIFVLIFTGCSSEPSTQNDPHESPIVSQEPAKDSIPYKEPLITGSWAWDGAWDYVYTFNRDGTGSYTYGDQELLFDYIDKGDLVEILYRGNTSPNIFHYTVNGTILSIEDSFGSYVTYLKTENGIPLSPFTAFNVNFIPEQTTAMSTFMNGGEYTVCNNTVYGQAYESDGTSEFVRFDLEKDGDFVKAVNSEIIERNVFPSYVTAYGDDIYYIRNNEGIYKVPKTGGTPECVISDAAEYLQIVNDTLYYCNADYNLCIADPEGSYIDTIIWEELYYPYFFDENWLIYQSDWDNESLHIRHLPTGSDVAICDIPSYSPILYKSDLFFVADVNGMPTLAKVDLNNIEINYDESTQQYTHTFDVEYSEHPTSYSLAITADGYIYNGLETGYSVDRWQWMENPDEAYDRAYPYTGISYNVFWEYNNDGLVQYVYVTDNSTGGSQPIPRFD